MPVLKIVVCELEKETQIEIQMWIGHGEENAGIGEEVSIIKFR